MLFMFARGLGQQEAAESIKLETWGFWVAEESVNEEHRVELRESLEAWNKTSSVTC